MLIALRGGHSKSCPGASGYVNEVTENRNIYPKVIDYLRNLGHTVIDVTSKDTADVNLDLRAGVQSATDCGADYFASIHLNAGGGTGTEVLYGSKAGKIIAERICTRMEDIGFKNRGAKDDINMYEIKNTKCPANIIEVFFCDSKDDVNLYKSIGADAVAKAIALGIVNAKAISQSNNTAGSSNQSVVKSDDNVKALQQLCNNFCIRDMNNRPLDVDGISGSKTQYCVAKLPICSKSSRQGTSVIYYVQNRLNQLGFKGKNGNKLDVDGMYGPQTLFAVTEYQKSRELDTDGIVGSNTWLSFLS